MIFKKKKQKKKHHRKKPTLSFDNDTDVNMKGYGENYLDPRTSVTSKSSEHQMPNPEENDSSSVTIGSVLHRYKFWSFYFQHS